MKNVLTKLMLVVIACSMPLSAHAFQAIEEKNLLSGKDTIEADSGYIFLHVPVRNNGMFLRVADDDDIEAYEKRWAEALAKAMQKYEKQLKRWERKVEFARRDKTMAPPKPEEITPETFAIEPIELLDPVSFGPQFVFNKSKDPESYSYMMKVRPGRYVYYGPAVLIPEPVGFCFCMGTVSFEVPAGKITNVGNFLIMGSDDDPDFPRTGYRSDRSEAGVYMNSPERLSDWQASYPLPDTLAAYAIHEPDYRAHGHLGNFFGLMVLRMPPVPGVLAYDRDRVIDVKALDDENSKAEQPVTTVEDTAETTAISTPTP